MHRLTLLVLAAVAFGTLAGAQGQETPDLKLKSAVYKETVEGDLKGAIVLYEQIAADASAPRPVAAAALLGLGGCYEKLGRAQARTVYERLVAEYPDQAREAGQARTRLAALAKPSAPAPGDALAGRRVIGPSYHLRGAVSKDGRYVAACCMVVHDIETGRERSFSNSMASTVAPVFSPDSGTIAYVAQPSSAVFELRVVGRDGEGDRLLLKAPDVTGIALFDWMPDGRDLLVRLTRSDKSTEMAFVPVSGGPPRTVRTPSPYTGPAERGHVSPDGRYFVYRAPGAAGAGGATRVFALDGSLDAVLVDRPANEWIAGWTGDGRFVFHSAERGSEGIWAVRVAGGRAQGSPERVAARLDADVRPVGLTRAGAFFYHRQAFGFQLHLVPVAPGSGAPRTPKTIETAMSPDWSPDGRLLAYAQSGSGLVTIQTLATGAQRTLWTGLPGTIMSLRWYPDLSALAAQGVGPEGGMSSIGLRRVDLATGALSEVQLGRGWSQFGANPTLSPDGRYLFYKGFDSDRQVSTLVRYDLKGGGQEVLLERRPPEYVSAFSLHAPTGRIAVALQDTNDPNDLSSAISSLGVLDASSRELRIVHRTTRGDYVPSTNAVAWMPDGRSLLFVTAPSATKGSPMSLFRMPASGGQTEKLFEAESIFTVRVHPDGARIAVDTRVFRMETVVVDNLLAPPRRR